MNTEDQNDLSAHAISYIETYLDKMNPAYQNEFLHELIDYCNSKIQDNFDPKDYLAKASAISKVEDRIAQISNVCMHCGLPAHYEKSENHARWESILVEAGGEARSLDFPVLSEDQLHEFNKTMNKLKKKKID